MTTDQISNGVILIVNTYLPWRAVADVEERLEDRRLVLGAALQHHQLHALARQLA